MGRGGAQHCNPARKWGRTLDAGLLCSFFAGSLLTMFFLSASLWEHEDRGSTGGCSTAYCQLQIPLSKLQTLPSFPELSAPLPRHFFFQLFLDLSTCSSWELRNVYFQIYWRFSQSETLGIGPVIRGLITFQGKQMISRIQPSAGRFPSGSWTFLSHQFVLLPWLKFWACSGFQLSETVRVLTSRLKQTSPVDPQLYLSNENP